MIRLAPLILLALLTAGCRSYTVTSRADGSWTAKVTTAWSDGELEVLRVKIPLRDPDGTPSEKSLRVEVGGISQDDRSAEALAEIGGMMGTIVEGAVKGAFWW